MRFSAASFLAASSLPLLIAGADASSVRTFTDGSAPRVDLTDPGRRGAPAPPRAQSPPPRPLPPANVAANSGEDLSLIPPGMRPMAPPFPNHPEEIRTGPLHSATIKD